MEPIEVSTTVEGASEEIIEEAIGAMPVMTSAPFGNIIVNFKRRLLDVIILLFCLNKIVTPRSRRYGDVIAMYIRMEEIPSRTYAKPQYRNSLQYIRVLALNK